ncbi:hypothetical protein JAAARDRAFT_610252 [Jaapia argillacea MUCL 33604]|uniref:Uncharacterized protein n=1 Tax=Jaapia argillacea MUCL 33604 TaxID=933084 RepID=A0A067P8A4_9AGAM|nr:hypothetical protein JAAARDRAFT_610252 [Jaapia argillacea MUCL 33604]
MQSEKTRGSRKVAKLLVRPMQRLRRFGSGWLSFLKTCVYILCSCSDIMTRRLIDVLIEWTVCDSVLQEILLWSDLISPFVLYLGINGFQVYTYVSNNTQAHFCQELPSKVANPRLHFGLW